MCQFLLPDKVFVFDLFNFLSVCWNFHSQILSTFLLPHVLSIRDVKVVSVSICLCPVFIYKSVLWLSGIFERKLIYTYLDFKIIIALTHFNKSHMN